MGVQVPEEESLCLAFRKHTAVHLNDLNAKTFGGLEEMSDTLG